MPDLSHCLNGYDLGFIEAVAELWGIELHAPDAKKGKPILCAAMLDEALFLEMFTALPDKASTALLALKAEGGRMPWTRFVARFGDLREMGPGRRDRQKPYRSPISNAESLWYRALIGKDFLEYVNQPQECAYLPQEFIEWLPEAPKTIPYIQTRPASPSDSVHAIHANDHILDLTCTLLAALRRAQPDMLPDTSSWNPPRKDLLSLIQALHLVTSEGLPNGENARPLLEADRTSAMASLVKGWMNSTLYNELRLMPSIICEGVWTNDPLRPRKMILDQISELADGQWWSINSFIQAINDSNPDFLRSEGEYDTWLIRSTTTLEALSGFSSWLEVEGALIRHLIIGPMHWLGLIDLAAPYETSEPTAFRTSAWFHNLLAGEPPQGLAVEDDPVQITSSGLLYMTTHTPRIVRYLISRFCIWEPATDGRFRYRLTPLSLQLAQEQGLKITHLISLLHRHGKSAPPPSLVRAIKRWKSVGQEAFFEQVCVLRLASPEILAALRQSPTAMFLGEPLGPVSVVVHKDAVDKVLAALARMGYLADVL